MNSTDIFLLILIGAVLAGAVITCIRNRKNGKNCGCGCSQCSGCKSKNQKK